VKVLVTGGCGFLGSHVCELFKHKGWDVLAYDNLTKFEHNRTGYKEEARDYNLKLLEGIGVPTIIDDITHFKMLAKAVACCDLVIHCAAQPAMTIAIEDPVLDFEVNVWAFLNLLEICKKRKIPLVGCSSIHVYGNSLNEGLVERETRFDSLDGPVGESWPLLGGSLSPLHASKRAAELYTQAYSDSYDLPFATFRLTGIYGPRQFGGEDHGWVANFAIKTVLRRPIKIFGTDKQVRDILYVKDAARAFLNWYERDCPSGIFNIGGGPETATSIQELLKLLKLYTGKESPIQQLPKRHGDLWWFVSDCNKASEAFGWLPYHKPSSGVQQLVAWVKENKELFK